MSIACKIIGKCLICFLLGTLLSIVNYLLAAYIDMLFAKSSGIISMPPLSSDWVEFATPTWMFTSPFGPALTLHISLFLILVILSGMIPCVIIVESIKQRKFIVGRFGWMLIITLFLWVIKIPMPGHWTLYYHIAVRF